MAGRLFAPHYAKARRGSVVSPAVMLRSAPHAQARAVSQLVLGDLFEELDVAGGWAWGRSVHDGYIGYLPAESVAAERPADHRVCAVTAPVFAEPDIKAPTRASWPIGSRFGGETAGDFIATAAGYLHRRHVLVPGERAADWVATAEALVGQPYLWGGRGAGGIDCSGLVQVALGLAGIAAPRDSDLQQAAIGAMLGEEAVLRRGDLVFFPGHVGIMVDETRMVHANAFWMAVTVEPLADVVRRLAPSVAQPVLARRRLEERA